MGEFRHIGELLDEIMPQLKRKKEDPERELITELAEEEGQDGGPSN